MNISKARTKLLENLSKELNIEQDKLKPIFLVFEKHLAKIKNENQKLKKLTKKSVRLSKKLSEQYQNLYSESQQMSETLKKSHSLNKRLNGQYQNLKENIIDESKSIAFELSNHLVEKFKKEKKDFVQYKKYKNIVEQVKTVFSNQGEILDVSDNEKIENYKEEINFLNLKIQQLQDDLIIAETTSAGDVAQMAIKTIEEEDCEICEEDEELKEDEMNKEERVFNKNKQNKDGSKDGDSSHLDSDEKDEFKEMEKINKENKRIEIDTNEDPVFDSLEHQFFEKQKQFSEAAFHNTNEINQILNSPKKIPINRNFEVYSNNKLKDNEITISNNKKIKENRKIKENNHYDNEDILDITMEYLNNL